MNLHDPVVRKYLWAGALALATVLFGKEFALQALGFFTNYIPAQ